MNRLAYDEIAPFYDAFQSEIRPEGWALFLQKSLDRHLEKLHFSEPQGDGGRQLAADLGCGTGLVTQALQDLGTDVIGIDISENMLAEARERAWEREDPAERPLYLEQDITAFELYGTVNLIYTSLDTFNHLKPDELEKCLKLCVNYLHPGGLLLFDLLSLPYMRTEMGGQFYYEIDENFALLWNNTFDEEKAVNRAALTLFQESETPGLYERRETEITEYYHAPEELLGKLEALGLKSELLPDDAARDAQLGIRGRHFIAAYKDVPKRRV